MRISTLLLIFLCGVGVTRAAPAPNASSEDLGSLSVDPGLHDEVSPEGPEVSVKQEAETSKAGLTSITDIKATENATDTEETSPGSDVDEIEPPILGVITTERRPVTVPEMPTATSDTAGSSKRTTEEKPPEEGATEDSAPSDPNTAAMESEAPILGSSRPNSPPATVPEDPQDATDATGSLEEEKAEAEGLPSPSSFGPQATHASDISTEDEAVKAGSTDYDEEVTDSVSDSDFISLLTDATDTGFDLLLDLLDETDADGAVYDDDELPITEEEKASEESSSGDGSLLTDDSSFATEEHKTSSSSSSSGSTTDTSKNSASASAGSASASVGSGGSASASSGSGGAASASSGSGGSASASSGSGGSASASSGSGGSASASSGGSGSPSILIDTDYDYRSESDAESDYQETSTDYGEDYKDYEEGSDHDYADYTEDYDEDYNDYDDSDMPNLSFSIFEDAVPRPPSPVKEKEEKEEASPCEWGVVNCCHDVNMVSRLKCFARLGCPGAWFESLCTPSIKRGVLRKVFRTVQG